MIFKIQRPLESNMPDPQCLIYNEDETVQIETSMEAMIAFVGPAWVRMDKIYVEGDYDGDTLSITKIINPQPW